MNLNAVLKIGGSLSRGSGLDLLCREIAGLRERFRLLIVPGGGRFADEVRQAYARFKLDETTAHRMALLAMDQYGCLLGDLISGSLVTDDLSCAMDAAESGNAAILLPSALVWREDPLPHSWQVTSDTIAAWIARTAHCRRLVLLKDVDGVLRREEPKAGSPRLINEITPARLSGYDGGVDEYLPSFLNSESLDTWVINGLHPLRLRELLETGHTKGTRIR